MTDRLLTPAELAEQLGMTERHLGQLRFYGGGPQFVKVSHKVVRYRQSDVDAWLESRLRERTQEVHDVD